MNIDEIKNRVELTKNNKLHHYGDGDVRDEITADWVAEFKRPVDAELFVHARSDILHLLSIIEQAEKALTHISFITRYSDHIVQMSAHNSSEEALKAIRGK